MLARFHNIAADAEQLAHDFRESGKDLAIPQILLAAKQLGLKAKLVRTDLARLPQTPLSDGTFAVDTGNGIVVLGMAGNDTFSGGTRWISKSRRWRDGERNLRASNDTAWRRAA